MTINVCIYEQDVAVVSTIHQHKIVLFLHSDWIDYE